MSSTRDAHLNCYVGDTLVKELVRRDESLLIYVASLIPAEALAECPSPETAVQCLAPSSPIETIWK